MDINVQLTTIEQARALAEIINSQSPAIGGGVAPEFKDPDNGYHNDKSGIFLPYWTDAGNQPEPGVGDFKQYCLRFICGAGGNNVGLVLDQALRHQSYTYALEQLRREVDDWVKANPQP